MTSGIATAHPVNDFNHSAAVSSAAFSYMFGNWASAAAMLAAGVLGLGFGGSILLAGAAGAIGAWVGAQFGSALVGGDTTWLGEQVGLDSLGNLVGQAVSDAFSTLADALSAGAKGLSNWMSGLADSIGEMADNFEDAVRDGLLGLSDFLNGLPASLADEFGDMANGIENAVRDGLLGLSDALNDLLPPWMQDSNPFDNPPISPLVIDLDGDGVELVSLENSNTQFDLDQDGFAEYTGWTTGDDAFLAYDLTPIIHEAT